MSQSTAIKISNLSFSYGSKPILDNFNLSVDSGKICCLVGSSGSGKTTALRLINGLLKPRSGEVYLNGNKLDYTKSEKVRRTMGYSIQGSGLFPHMTLYENLTIIAKKEGWNAKQLQERVHELCELMSLPKDQAFLNKKPRQISGGQQQRVGIARALFMKPKIMLMDEPFSALDPITRSELQNEFVNLQSKLQLTIVLVTHDLSEAFRMGHEIILLNNGQVEQKGRPSRFLLTPESDYVKEFLDSHSPGNILKEVYLYSVVNTDVYTSEKNGEQIQLKHIDSGDTSQLTSLQEAESFLKSKGQSAHYWVEGENFRSLQEFGQNENSITSKSTNHILDGMQALLRSKTSTLPVVNDKNKLIGVFSEEAINAL